MILNFEDRINNTINTESTEGFIWELGKFYPEHKNLTDSVTYSVDSNGIILKFLYKRPTALEIAEFHDSIPQFALVEAKGIQFFMSKFGRLHWSSSANNFSLNMTEKLESVSNVLTCMMFDTSTGKLVAIRTLGLHQKFVDRVVDGINKQLDTPLSYDEFAKRVKDVYLQYPTDSKLLKNEHCRYNLGTGKVH